MRTHLKNPTVLIWIALVVATFASWAISGVEHGTAHGPGPNLGIAAVLAIAFLKSYLVGDSFMELRTASRPLRLAFGGWIVGVGAMVISMYLLA